MAVEPIRGCGYRKVGGLYLVGGYLDLPCDRLPMPLPACPTCGHAVKLTRTFTEFNPYRLMGIHNDCQDGVRPCLVCDPPDDIAFAMRVGARYYTPQSFLEEARAMGISKRIPWLPKNLILGTTIVYLAHKKTIVAEKEDPNDKDTYLPGSFAAFIPKQVDKIMWQSGAEALTDKDKEQLAKRGINPVAIPDGDKDHA